MVQVRGSLKKYYLVRSNGFKVQNTQLPGGAGVFKSAWSIGNYMEEFHSRSSMKFGLVKDEVSSITHCFGVNSTYNYSRFLCIL